MGITVATAINSNQPFKRKAHLDHPTLGTRWLTVCQITSKIKYLHHHNGVPEYWIPTANDLVANDYEICERPFISIKVLNEVLGRHLATEDKKLAIEELLTRHV